MHKRWACKPVAERLMAETAQRVEALKARGVAPHLAVALTGDNPASHVYVRNKVKACESLGIRSTLERLPAETLSETLLDLTRAWNRDDSIHGILVQLPLPGQIEERLVIEAIAPDKDVDGFNPVNVGRLWLGEDGLFPCTPMGVMALLRDSGVQLKGKHAVVVGRSNIVGKPMAQLLLREHCTVTLMHSRTREPETVCRQADIVIAAVGRPGLVSADWLKEGAYVVDVGINEITDPRLAAELIPADSKKMEGFRKKGRALYGDVNYYEAKQKAALVTPVPGGVGQLTIAQLMANCVTAAERSVS